MSQILLEAALLIALGVFFWMLDRYVAALEKL